MGDLIRLEDARRARRHNVDIIMKIVDGVPVACVDLDAMTPEQRAAYFAQDPNRGTTEQ